MYYKLTTAIRERNIMISQIITLYNNHIIVFTQSSRPVTKCLQAQNNNNKKKKTTKAYNYTQSTKSIHLVEVGVGYGDWVPEMIRCEIPNNVWGGVLI